MIDYWILFIILLFVIGTIFLFDYNSTLLVPILYGSVQTFGGEESAAYQGGEESAAYQGGEESAAYQGGEELTTYLDGESASQQNKEHIGGSQKGKVVIGDDAKFVFDGHNLIHGLSGKSSISLEEFEYNLKLLSKCIEKAMPGKNLHIVLKNPGEKLTELFNKKYQPVEKNSKKRKKSYEEKIPYFQQLVEISKDYPSITYHLAYGKEPSDQDKSRLRHYLKGRDDILTIYLAKSDGYIVSMDQFRDFSQFSKIKPFKHFSVRAGDVLPKEDIKPNQLMVNLRSPNLGNHIKYKFVSNKELKKLGIKNGDIYVDNDIYRYSHLYLVNE